MSEESTKFQKFLASTTTLWQKHKPRPGSTAVLSGGLIGCTGTAFEIIERGIKGEQLNMWYAVKFLFCFTIACCKSWELWHQPPPGPRTFGYDPEGHLK